MIQTNINNIPDSMLLEIYKKLDYKDLITMRSVNKRFQAVSDDKSLDPVFTLIKSRKAFLEIKNFRNNQKTLFARFVTFITFESKFLSKVTKLFCKLFPSIKREIETRQQIQAKLKRLNLPNTEALENKKFWEYYELKKKFDAFSTVMGVFGGIKRYETLPLLDIGDQNLYKDNIAPKQMKYPIMRGVDKNGNRFFTIRFRKKGKENKKVCLTVIECRNSHNEICWLNLNSKPRDFLPCPGNGISRGVDVNKINFDVLERAIRERTFNVTIYPTTTTYEII
jgi:hypothetical protein